jgi:NET1-associated nuclear protein 1 (U3 small nucleolar RNA-associated protein 17)
VYSASDSLLLRRIPISSLNSSSTKGTIPATIVATRLSQQTDDHVWVACSDGRIFLVNWKEPSEDLESFQTNSSTARDLSVVSLGSGKSAQEVVVVAESDKSQRLDLTAYLFCQGSAPLSRSILNLKKNGTGLQLVQSSPDGSVIVGAINDRLFIGAATKGALETFDQLRYEFFSFDTPDLITAIDVKVSNRRNLNGSSSKGEPESDSVVDIIVGGARGSIYLYHDALTKIKAAGKSKSEKDIVQAQKYHWHRKAVHSVKWSRDGTYRKDEHELKTCD